MGWDQDEKDGIRVPFEEGWIIPEKKQYWFMKRSAADVVVTKIRGVTSSPSLLVLESSRVSLLI